MATAQTNADNAAARRKGYLDGATLAELFA